MVRETPRTCCRCWITSRPIWWRRRSGWWSWTRIGRSSREAEPEGVGGCYERDGEHSHPDLVSKHFWQLCTPQRRGKYFSCKTRIHFPFWIAGASCRIEGHPAVSGAGAGSSCPGPTSALACPMFLPNHAWLFHCFHKSLQLRTWSACGPNWLNGPHVGRISLEIAFSSY